MLFNIGNSFPTERALDGLSMRFQAASHNLANVHTPGYKRQEVPFEESLKLAVEMSEEQINPDNPMDGPYPNSNEILEAWNPQMRVIDDRAQRVDGNGVSLENEMSTITQTALMYNMMAGSVAGKYRLLKFVIDAR